MNNNISSDKYYKKYLKYKKKYLNLKKSYGGAAVQAADGAAVQAADGQAYEYDDLGPLPPPPPPMRARPDEDTTTFSDFKDVFSQVISNEDLKTDFFLEDANDIRIYEMDGDYENNLINAASDQLEIDAASGQLKIDVASEQFEIDTASDQLEIEIEDLEKLKDKSKNSTVESNFDSILVEKEKQIAELTKKIHDLRIQAAHKILFPLSYEIIERIKEKIRELEDWNFDRGILTRSCNKTNYTSQLIHLVTYGTGSCMIETILTPLFDELNILNAKIINTGKKFYDYENQTSIVKAEGVQADINEKRSEENIQLQLMSNRKLNEDVGKKLKLYVGGNNNPNK